MGADFGATIGSRIEYDVPNRMVTAWRRKLPVWTGWWRGLGLFANTFAVESFVDELARGGRRGSAAVPPRSSARQSFGRGA